MGAIKDNPYTEKEHEVSMIGRAIKHPLRASVLSMLNNECQSITNVELTKIFKMKRSTIKDHLDKLKDADFIEVEYDSNHYNISLNKKGRIWAKKFGL